MGFLTTILVGLIAGWLAEKIMKTDLPTWKSLLLGLIGGALGSFVLGLIGYNSPTGLISGSLVAAAGACLILWAYGKLRAR
ncbi:MAG: GlsB/YeaQ/YmgE family stress response membrane protein [Clostridia bacterium]|nr:GlsB/YeaQ/YmgE family stress response membrane protein [Clostridia bacterium]